MGMSMWGNGRHEASEFVCKVHAVSCTFRAGITSESVGQETSLVSGGHGGRVGRVWSRVAGEKVEGRRRRVGRVSGGVFWRGRKVEAFLTDLGLVGGSAEEGRHENGKW
jgi:hypothetical protein